jgi:hypothetical protein
MPNVNKPFKYEKIKYGNYTFHAFNKATLNKQNVYSDDGIVVKYIRCTLEVDFIIASETVDKTYVPGTALPVDPSIRGIDAEMDFIREELQSPNKELVLFYHGAGAKTNVPGRARDNKVLIGDSLKDDVTNPYNVPFSIINSTMPEVVQWEPLGANNAARCRWRCVFNVPTRAIKYYPGNQGSLEDTDYVRPADSYSLGGNGIGKASITNESRSYAGIERIEYIVNNYISNLFATEPPLTGSGGTNFVNYLLSHTEEQECEIEEDGTAIVTLTGTLEFVSSGALFDKLKETPAAIPRLLQILTHYFEPLHPPGFTRTQKYKYRKSKREIEYTIVDREIKSDNPILPNIVKADVSHSVSSNLLGTDPFEGQGFVTWNNVFEGTITVRPGVWKGWAWIAMMTIVRQRMYRTQPFAGEGIADLKGIIESQVADPNNLDKKVQPKHLLHKITIKENIYSRDVSFNLSYMTMNNLNQLFMRTGLFYPAYIAWTNTTEFNIGDVPLNPWNQEQIALPKSYNDQWAISREYMANAQNVFGYRGPMLPGYDMVYDPYDGYDANRFANPDATRNPEAKLHIPKTLGPDGLPTNNPVGNANFSTTRLNVDTLAERRRNAHYDTFGNLSFPNPDNLAQPKGGFAPIKEAVGLNGRKVAGTYNYPAYTESEDSSYLRGTDPKDTWLSYDTMFIVHRKENSVLFPSIQPQLASSRQHVAVPTSSGKTAMAFSIHGNANVEPSASGYDYNDPQVFGLATTYIQVTGRAMRAGYGIPCPVFVGCKNPLGNTVIPAYRVGSSQFTCYQVGRSSDVPIFQASWNMMYALKGDPSCASIGYVTNQPTEFA